MITRFSPSLNGSLHIGHLWMAWVNYAWAHQVGGRFILRYDDLAPGLAGDDTTRQVEWAAEGEELLRAAGVVPDCVSYVSKYQVPDLPLRIESRNTWLRQPALEGWKDVACSPALVAARVRADIEEGVDVVIRGEELAPELQLYEYLNQHLGGSPRHLVYLPRLRVRVKGQLTTISKTYGNLQLRDIYSNYEPAYWLERVREVGLISPDKPVSLDNIYPDPVLVL